MVPTGLGRADLARLRAAGVLGVTLNAALLGVEHYADAGPQLAALAELDMIADVQVVDDQLLALGPLLDRAGVRVVVDHCGRPDPRRGLRDPGFQELLRRGREGRAVVKLSGLYKFSQRPHPHEDAWPFVRALVDAFGPDRCVWASDWPFLRAPARIDYGPLLRAVRRDRAGRPGPPRHPLGHPAARVLPGTRERHPRAVGLPEGAVRGKGGWCYQAMPV